MTEFANASLYADYVDLARIARECVVVIVSIIGVYIATRGLQTWRHQLHGNTEYELARRLLRATFRVRDKIRMVRNPYMSSSEISQAVENEYPNEPDRKEDHADSTTAVYNSRWNQLREALSDLNVECVESEVIWGDHVPSRLKPLHAAIIELHVAIIRHLRQFGRRPEEISSEEQEKIDRMVYEISEDPDKDAFTARIQSAVNEVQEFLKPKLKI